MKPSHASALVLLAMGLPAFAQSNPDPLLANSIPFEILNPNAIAATNLHAEVVVPFAARTLSTSDFLQVRDAGGMPVPAQFKVLARYFDGTVGSPASVKMVRVTLPVTVAAFSSGNVTSGIANFTIRNDATAPASGTPLAQDLGTSIEIVTGPMKALVRKSAFNLLDEVFLDLDQNGSFSSPSERIVNPSANNGGWLKKRVPQATPASAWQLDSSLAGWQVAIEENGPELAVIVAKTGPATLTTNVQNTAGTFAHEAGRKVRLYFYKGRSWVKVEYQLQNSPLVPFGWNFYHRGHRLDLDLALSLATERVRFSRNNFGNLLDVPWGGGKWVRQSGSGTLEFWSGNSPQLLQTWNSSAAAVDGGRLDGYLDVADAKWGVSAMNPYCFQKFPSGIESAGTRLSVEFDPEWGPGTITDSNHPNPEQWYWLQDMQHSIREAWYWFHGPVTAAPGGPALSTTHQGIYDTHQQLRYELVPHVHSDHWRGITAHSMGGEFPPGVSWNLTGQTSRRPQFTLTQYEPHAHTAPTSDYGWTFGIDKNRLTYSATPGGTPYSAAYLRSGYARDWFSSKYFALAELNVRPQWMAEYDFDTDYNGQAHFLNLQDTGYPNGNWRCQAKGFVDWVNMSGTYVTTIPNSGYPYGFPPLTGTPSRYANARDSAHGWLYHVAEYYFLSGDRWIADWYRFVYEFYSASMIGEAPWGDLEMSARGLGHALHSFADAIVIAERPEGIAAAEAFVEAFVLLQTDPATGRWYKGREFMKGYLQRAICHLMALSDEVGHREAYLKCMHALIAHESFNTHYPANFCYECGTVDTQALEDECPSGSSLVSLDPIFHAVRDIHGLQAFSNHALAFVNGQLPMAPGCGSNTPGGLNPMAWDIGSSSGSAYPYWEPWHGRSAQIFAQNTKTDWTPPAAFVIQNVSRVGPGTVRVTCQNPAATDVAYLYAVVTSQQAVTSYIPNLPIPPAAVHFWDPGAQVIPISAVPTPGGQQDYGLTGVPGTPFYVAILACDESGNLTTSITSVLVP